MIPVKKLEDGGKTYIAVASDIHYAVDDNGESEEKLVKALNVYKKLAYSDGFLFAGDMVNNGFEEEYNGFMKVIRENLLPKTKFVTCMGNHEWYRHGWGVDIRRNPGFTEMYHELYEKCTGNTIEMDETVNGIHLIAVSPDDESDRISTREPFLTEHIRAAAEEDPEKPIFVAVHKAVKNTVVSSFNHRTGDTAFLSEEFSDEFLDFLSHYPQVIFVSGHTHVSLRFPTSIHQKDFTSIQSGVLGGSPSSGLLFSVSPENIVTVYRVNFTDETIYEEPWIIDIPAAVKDKSSFRYTDKRQELAADPVLCGTFETVKLSSSDVTLKYPTATVENRFDDGFVFAYLFRLKETGSGIYIDQCDDPDSEFPLDCRAVYTDVDNDNNSPRTVSFENLKPGTEYEVEIRAVSPFWRESKPSYFTFRTKD